MRPGAGAPHPTAGSAASPCGPPGERSNGRNREIDAIQIAPPLKGFAGRHAETVREQREKAGR